MSGARGNRPTAVGQRCIAPGLRSSSRVVAMELAHVFRSGLLLALLGVGVAAAAPPMRRSPTPRSAPTGTRSGRCCSRAPTSTPGRATAPPPCTGRATGTIPRPRPC